MEVKTLKNKKSLLLLIMLLLLNAKISANTEYAGTTSSNFLKIPPYARAVGMGEAFTAISDGTYGIYYNPAGLTSIVGYEIQATHINWFQGINYEFLSFACPFPIKDAGKMGFSFAWMQYDEMQNTSTLPSGSLQAVDLDSLVNYSFSPFSYSASLAYGFDIRDNLSAGISLRLTSENIDAQSGLSIAGDLGIIYKLNLTNNFIRFGLNASNIGTDLKLGVNGYESPKLFKAGVSDKISIFDNNLLLSAQAILQLDYDMLYSFGAEYWIYNLVALRAGYKLGAFNHPTFGGGIKYNNFEFDYAIVSYENLGITHRFSLLYSWGTPQIKLKVLHNIFSPNNDKYIDTAFLIPELKIADTIKSIKLNIYDSQTGQLLSEIPVKNTLNTKIPWNGKVKGTTLNDDIYKASITAEYENGTSESEQIPIEIDTTPPTLRVDGEPKLLRPGKKDSLIIPATFTFYAKDRNDIAKWQLVVWDKDKKIFFSTKGKGNPPLSYVWDGKGASGDYVDTGEIYYYSLSAYDTLGNATKTKPQAQVVLLKEIKLTFKSDTLFDLGKADVKQSAYHTLKQIRNVLEKFSKSKIMINGHTDTMEKVDNKYKNSTELSFARAKAIKFFIVNLLGIDDKNIETTGFGSAQPIASNDTQEGRQKNRRVEIIIQSTVYR